MVIMLESEIIQNIFIDEAELSSFVSALPWRYQDKTVQSISFFSHLQQRLKLEGLNSLCGRGNIFSQQAGFGQVQVSVTTVGITANYLACKNVIRNNFMIFTLNVR